MGKDMMSKIRAGDVWKAMARVLDEFRIPKEDWDVLDKRPHPHLIVRYCGRERFISFPSTPGGYRSPYKYSAALRRMLKEMQMGGFGDLPTMTDQLTIIRIVKIPFYGSDISVLPGATPQSTLVAMKPIVEGMGLDWSGQFNKIKGHPLLSKGIEEFSIPSAGGPQMMTALPLNRLHFWLATIQPNKVPDIAVRDRVMRFQDEAADVLFDHFFGRALAGHDQQDDRHFGISKMTIHKVTQIEEQIKHLEQQVNSLIVGADARVAVLDYVTVFELLNERHAIQKGRRSLNSKVGAALRGLAMSTGCIVKRCPITARHLFPRDFAEGFMAAYGNAMIRDHNDRQTGQTTLDLGAHA